VLFIPWSEKQSSSSPVKEGGRDLGWLAGWRSTWPAGHAPWLALLVPAGNNSLCPLLPAGVTAVCSDADVKEGNFVFFFPFAFSSSSSSSFFGRVD